MLYVGIDYHKRYGEGVESLPLTFHNPVIKSCGTSESLNDGLSISLLILVTFAQLRKSATIGRAIGKTKQAIGSRH